MRTITLIIMFEWTDWTIDGDLVEVWSTKSTKLSIQIREQTTLHQRIVSEVHSRDDVGSAEGHLLSFREEVVRITVQNHFPNSLNGYEFFWNKFARIQKVEVKFEFIFFLDNLPKYAYSW